MTCSYCVALSPLFSSPGSRPQCLGQAGGDLELVAEGPGADLLAGGLADVVEAGVLPGHGPRARALEDLGNVHEVRAALAGLEDLGDPRDRELGAVGRRADLLRDDRRSAVDELDVQVLRVEVALLLGREVAGELRLRDPLELEADLFRCGGFGGRGRACGRLAGRRRRGCRCRGRRGGRSRGRGRARARGEQHRRRGHEPEDARLLPHASPLLRRPARRGANFSSAAAEPRDRRNDTGLAGRAEWTAPTAGDRAVRPRCVPSCATG